MDNNSNTKQNAAIKQKVQPQNKLFAGITVLDTCGSITGTLKAVMKALVWADISCLHPPHYLGRINNSLYEYSKASHNA